MVRSLCQNGPFLHRSLCQNGPFLHRSLCQNGPFLHGSLCQNDPFLHRSLCQNGPFLHRSLCQNGPFLHRSLCQNGPFLRRNWCQNDTEMPRTLQKKVDLMRRCNYILNEEGKPEPFTASDQEELVRSVIEPMASNGLRTICIAYKDFIRGMWCCLFSLFFRLFGGRGVVVDEDCVSLWVVINPLSVCIPYGQLVGCLAWLKLTLDITCKHFNQICSHLPCLSAPLTSTIVYHFLWP